MSVAQTVQEELHAEVKYLVLRVSMSSNNSDACLSKHH